MEDPSSAVISMNKYFSLCDFISGWTAGIISMCVGHPMDTIRIVQQVTNTNALKATREIYNRNKVSGYFRGIMFPILSTGIVNSVFFGINGNVMRAIQVYRNNGTTNDVDIDVRYCCDAVDLNRYWHLDVFVSACFAGCFYSLINTPTEVVKTMLQASNVPSPRRENPENPRKNGPPKINNSIRLITELYKTNGIRSLYKGGTVLMLRDVPSMGIYMLSYEHLCCMMKTWSFAKTLDATNSGPMPKHIQIISGGIAGILSWILVLPFDVIKSKLIADSPANSLYKGPWDCTKKTYAEGGLRRFFQGFWLVCVRAFPVNCITFLVYEICLDTCNNSI